MEDITNQIVANTGMEMTEMLPELQGPAPEEPEVKEAAPEEAQREETAAAKESWRKLSEQAEEGKRTKDELREAHRLLARMEQKIQDMDEKKRALPVEEEFNIDDLADDEYSDNKKLKRILKQQERRYQLREERSQKESQEQRNANYKSDVSARLREAYPDYKKVTSPKNIDKLRELKPYLYNSFSANPDLYEAASGVYEEIMSLGIYKENKYANDDYQMKNNMNKPRSGALVGSSKKESAIDSISRFNNPSATDLKAFYEDAIKKSGRSSSYNE